MLLLDLPVDPDSYLNTSFNDSYPVLGVLNARLQEVQLILAEAVLAGAGRGLLPCLNHHDGLSAPRSRDGALHGDRPRRRLRRVTGRVVGALFFWEVREKKMPQWTSGSESGVLYCVVHGQRKDSARVAATAVDGPEGAGAWPPC